MGEAGYPRGRLRRPGGRLGLFALAACGSTRTGDARALVALPPRPEAPPVPTAKEGCGLALRADGCAADCSGLP